MTKAARPPICLAGWRVQPYSGPDQAETSGWWSEGNRGSAETRSRACHVPITTWGGEPPILVSSVPVWTRHSIRCSHPAPDTNSPCVEKASVGAGAFVASASVWRVMYIWSRCGSGADTRVSRRQASVCLVSSPPARRCKAECQLGHYHRLTFAAALPTAQLSDIQGRCGGGRKGVGWWPVGCFFFFACSVDMCVCVFL